MKNSKRGAAMVEAAIVFPLVIAAVMAVIYLMVNLYSLTALQSALHVELRGEAGAESGLTDRTLADGAARDRYRTAAERDKAPISHAREFVHPYVHGEKSKLYAGNAMVADKVLRRSQGRSYIVDEAQFFRRLAFLKALVKTPGGGG